jgi:hypothetical protein
VPELPKQQPINFSLSPDKLIQSMQQVQGFAQPPQ